MASLEIADDSTVGSTACSGLQQRKRRRSALLDLMNLADGFHAHKARNAKNVSIYQNVITFL